MSAVSSDSPYVGPRAFRPGERLPARRRETRELTDLLIAERVLLLHSPSGAGKTSLIQAGVAPLLRQKTMLRERPFRPTVPLRVKTPAPRDHAVRNRYVYSVALDLLRDRDTDPRELESLTLSEALQAAMPPSATEIPVLIFDQFEEILTLNPADRDNQRTFFQELGAVLADNHIWALFAMREDYMGGLDRYVSHLPGHLRTTYRLDFLDTTAARIAIREPARERGVTFTEEAANELLRRLTTVRVQRPCHGVEEIQAPYVQPFQLQVVCLSLWMTLIKKKGSEFATIELEDVERYADIGRALRGYYADTVGEVAKSMGAEELVIRDWFEDQLITAQQFRGQTLTGPESGQVEPVEVVRALQDAYLVRSDTRVDSTWYELAHDQLIAPILDSNRAWRTSRLESWQLRSRDWHAKHQRALLLRGSQLRYAEERARVIGATEAEREFLQESAHNQQDRGLVDRTRSGIGLLGFLALLELVVILVLLILLLRAG
jgi:hypothetical protein